LTSSSSLNGRRRLEYLLLFGGLFYFGTALFQFARYEIFEHNPEAFLNVSAPARSAPQKLLGRLEIPRLAVSVAVLEGDTDDNLSLGVAHLDGTATLGSRGNAAIAGHRDLAFQALGAIRNGDFVLIKSSADLTYRVVQTKIVNPTDTSVLASDGRALLTLITCYPFHYAGSAPQRFIVEAELQK
jgi:sortase A